MNPKILDYNPLYPKAITLFGLSTIKRGEPIIVTDVRYGSNRIVFHSEPRNMDGYIKMLVVHQNRVHQNRIADDFNYSESMACLSEVGIIPSTERWNDAHFCIKDTAEERQALLDYLVANPNLGWNYKQIEYDIMSMDKS